MIDPKQKENGMLYFQIDEEYMTIIDPSMQNKSTLHMKVPINDHFIKLCNEENVLKLHIESLTDNKVGIIYFNYVKRNK